MKPWARVIVWGFVALVAASSADAAIHVTGEGALTASTRTPVSHICPDHPDRHACVDSLDPNPVEYLSGPSAACQLAMSKDFPGWQPTYYFAADKCFGTIDILTYRARDFAAGAAKHDPGCSSYQIGMGAELYAQYLPDPRDNFHAFRWIQIIQTSDPPDDLNPPNNRPYVDPYSKDDTKPFFWTEEEYGTKKCQTEYGEITIGIYDFFDLPKRPCPCYGLKTWRAELYLSDWYGEGSADPNRVIIYEGIRWGFDISCVPEPASLIVWLLLVALAFTVEWRRRRSGA